MPAIIATYFDSATKPMSASMIRTILRRLKSSDSGGAKRAYLFPNTPSMAEAGYPNFDANSHMGIYAPAGTPPEIVNKLHAAVVATLNNPQVREKLQEMGGTPAGTSPQEFAAFLKADSERAMQMLKDTNVQARK